MKENKVDVVLALNADRKNTEQATAPDQCTCGNDCSCQKKNNQQTTRVIIRRLGSPLDVPLFYQ